MQFKVDKSNWKKVRLGDVATEYSKRCNNPSESGFERFIGSSNINQWDFRIKSWESTDSVTSAMKLFEPNDYLLVRRSLYASDFRERAPRVNFAGVCSGDILTIRENPKMIADGFLIGILNSPALWKYVVANASGSITRRIKWRDLANYEFLLPPKEQQAELAELLWAMDEVIEKDLAVLERLEEYKYSLQRHYWDDTTGEYIEIGEVAKVFSGGTPERKKPEYWGGSIPWIKTTEVNYNTILETEEYITEIGLKSSATKMIKPNSVLVAMYGQGVTRGRVAITGIEACCNQACGVIELKDFYSPLFMYLYLEYRYEELRALAHGANQQNLNLQMVKSFKVPKLAIEEQKRIVDSLIEVSESRKLVNSKILASKNLQKSLINEIF